MYLVTTKSRKQMVAKTWMGWVLGTMMLAGHVSAQKPGSDLFFLNLNTDCTSQWQPSQDVPFELSFTLKKVERSVYDFVMDLDIQPDDWVVSSCSTDSMFGKVQLRFPEDPCVTYLGKLDEFPPSGWEVEPFSGMDIKVIRQDTRMTQRLNLHSCEKGLLMGEVFFVVEPLCMPFETTFALQPTLDGTGDLEVVNLGSRFTYPPNPRD